MKPRVSKDNAVRAAAGANAPIVRRMVRFAAACGLAVMVPAVAQAQPPDWKIETEANASVFFGNSDQRVIATRGEVVRVDSLLEVEASMRFAYADAAVRGEDREVTKRSWIAALSADHRPYARYTPFLFGSVESSFEKRITRRYSAGLGGKLTFARTPRTETSVSLALVGERTNAAATIAPSGDGTLARWSSRFKARHAFDDRLSFTHETYYRPSVRSASDFNVASSSAIAYQLRESVSLTFSFVDSYDSEARRRGANSNNDGQILAGVLARF